MLKIVRERQDFDFSAYAVRREALLQFADCSLFADNEHRYEEAFYGRRLRPHVLKHLDFSRPITVGEIGNYAAFAANRVLLAINECELGLLPVSGLPAQDHALFYDKTRLAVAGLARDLLEEFLFSWLDGQIQIGGNWTESRVLDFLKSERTQLLGENHFPVADSLLEVSNDRVAAQDFLIQLCPDFLLESSAMAGFAAGSYGGELASSLFKILIDEHGYGVFETKHATLFEKCLSSAGLSAVPHTYFQYYLNSTLLLANYFYYITHHKRLLFRYMGALFFAETGFVKACDAWRRALRECIAEIDVRYFDEHCHIDLDHSDMVLNQLVAPCLQKFGATAAAEIVRGFEEARLLMGLADQDFVAQRQWKKDNLLFKDLHDRVFPNVRHGFEAGKIKRADLDEPLGELSITHVHDGDELCHIETGEMEFLNGYGVSTILHAGQGTIIKRGRLHGALIRSDRCEYSIYSIGEVDRWR